MNAFSFLKKLLLFSAGLIPLIVVVTLYNYRGDIKVHGLKSIPTNNFSNSISFNSQVQHLNEVRKINSVQLLVLGSSMALNNISAEMIEDSLGVKTYNFSSWGIKGPMFLKIMENIEFKNCRTVLLPFSNQDMNDSIQFELNNLPLVNRYLQNKSPLLYGPASFFYNFNFNDFQNNWKTRSRDLYKTNTYTSLQYGRCGSALLDSAGFEISKKRYERYYDTTGFSNFHQNLNSLRSLLMKKNVSLILVYLPWRKDLLTRQREQENNVVASVVRAKFGNQFVDLHHLEVDESLFCDGSHFFRPGAEIVTKQVIDTVKKK